MSTEFTIDGLTMSVVWTQPGATSILLIAHQEGTDKSHVVRLDADTEVTIGRSRQATIVADHEKVSRLHAKIMRRGDRVFVADLDSRNGTQVNGSKISSEVEVRSGDAIAVGPVVMVVSARSTLRRGTAIVDADAFETRLRAEIDRARRYQRSVTVAALNVAGDDAGIEAIARALRDMDLMADYGGDNYAILLPELSRANAVDLLTRLADAAAQGNALMRAGVATAPIEGVSVEAIMHRARTALRLVRSPQRIAVNPDSIEPTTTTAILISPVMRNVYALVERVVESPITVLILGETGSGKELVAEAIATGPRNGANERTLEAGPTARKDRPFVKLNCASLPETLLESELFGHERGSFTGADRRKIGFFEAASGGTLFLDEIGEFPLNLQAKLLRVLESKKITRVGGTEEIAVDTRVVAATHRDLDVEVKAGRFREDLYFRISAFTVAVPPLRNRSDEIIPLAEHFMHSVGNTASGSDVRLTDDAKAALLAYDWPGNVRELRNAIERAMVLQTEAVITAADLPERIKEAGLRAGSWTAGAGAEVGMRDQLGAVERNALQRALEAVGNNQTQAAKALGISRRALIYKMEKYGLKAPPNSREEQ